MFQWGKIGVTRRKSYAPRKQQIRILNGGYIAGISKRGMLIVIAISLYNGFASSGVNNLAHIGGLLAGFLLSILLCREGNAKRCSRTDF